jgi:Leucine-rich repeat (LRR) protein
MNSKKIILSRQVTLSVTLVCVLILMVAYSYFTRITEIDKTITVNMNDSLVLCKILSRFGYDRAPIDEFADFESIGDKKRIVQIRIASRTIDEYYTEHKQDALDEIFGIFRKRPALLAGLGQLKHLRSFSLIDIPLDNIFPKDLDSLNKLEFFAIQNAGISEFPEFIIHSHGLKYLNLSQNSIKAVPTSICELDQLAEINLLKNPIRRFADENCGMQSIRIIRIDESRINAISPKLKAFSIE